MGSLDWESSTLNLYYSLLDLYWWFAGSSVIVYFQKWILYQTWFLVHLGHQYWQIMNVTLLTILFMFHLISFSSHFSNHVSFLFPSVHGPSHSFHLPEPLLFIVALFGCTHITWSFNLIVSFTFQPILSLEINNL